MAWIEFDQAVWTNKKTLMLAAILGIDEEIAVVRVAKLWHWCVDNAQDGELGHLPPYVIARAANWQGDAEQFVAAMIEAGWLDKRSESLTVHDWWDYAGRLIERRKQDAERKRQGRQPRTAPDGPGKSPGRPAPVLRTSEGNPPDVQRNSTVHNQTEQNSTQQNQNDKQTRGDESEAEEVLRILALKKTDRRLESVTQQINDHYAVSPVLVAVEHQRWVEEDAPPDYESKDVLAAWGRKMAKYDKERWTQFLRPLEADESSEGWTSPAPAQLGPHNTQLWGEIRVAVAEQLRGNYPVRFGGAADSMRGDVLVLRFSDDYEREWASNYADTVSSCAESCGYPDLEIEYTVLGDNQRAAG